MKKLKALLPYFIITLVVFVLGWVNYYPKMWLCGWDNLNPEFNFALNIKRSIFSVWQEYQGLGTVGGLGYASDLVREVILSIFSKVLPTNFLRWFYTFLMLAIGPLGVYVLMEKAVFAKEEGLKKKCVSLSGALFYLLNFATVQIFYFPFEPFIVHFGFLPWLVYSLLLVLKEFKGRRVLLFAVLNLLAVPQGYVPTIFIVYILGFFLIILGQIFNKKQISWKNYFSSLALIFLINAFWFFPFLGFMVTNVKAPVDSHMNRMSSENIYLKNKKFGTLGKVALLEGFSFDITDKGRGQDYVYVFDTWRDYIGRPVIQAIGFLLFGIVLLGIFSAFKKKNKYSISFFLLFIFSFVMLANDSFPFFYVTSFLRKAVPLFAQVFRVPFTKFGNLASFSYSVFFSFGVGYLVSFSAKLLAVKIWNRLICLAGVIIAGSALVIFTLPIFSGNLFYWKIKLEAPQEYFSLMNWFEEKKQGRVAVFPEPTYWGWKQYSWDYVGSGFLWYGVGQPILDRAFDGYSKYNENFYWQVSQAIYSQDIVSFESILEKYQIEFLVLDKNIRGGSEYKVLYISELEDLFAKSERIKLAREFEKIKVYGVDLDIPVSSFVSIGKDLPVVGPEYEWNDSDVGFLENGHYVSSLECKAKNEKLTRQLAEKSEKVNAPGVKYSYYPFRSLFTGRKQEELEFEIVEKDNYFAFVSKEFLPAGKLVLPLLSSESVFWNKELQKEVSIPRVYIGDDLIAEEEKVVEMPFYDKRIKVEIDKKKGYFSYDSYDKFELLDRPLVSCDSFNEGLMEKDVIEKEGERYIRFSSVDSNNCIGIDLPHSSQKTGYLVKVKSRYIEGKSLLFYMVNKTSGKRFLETYLPKNTSGQSLRATLGSDGGEVTASYFIIPPMQKDGQGYSLHFDNISIGRVKTVNDLGRIEVYPIPYRFLKGIRLENSRPGLEFSRQVWLDEGDFEVEHPNPSYYKVRLFGGSGKARTVGSFGDLMNDEGAGGVAVSRRDVGACNDSVTLVLSQAYHDGWIAFSKEKAKLEIGSASWRTKLEVPKIKILSNHVLVNNWANGWDIKVKSSDELTIYIFFWPQLLEYVGFGLLGVGLVCVLIKVRSGRRIGGGKGVGRGTGKKAVVRKARKKKALERENYRTEYKRKELRPAVLRYFY